MHFPGFSINSIGGFSTVILVFFTIMTTLELASENAIREKIVMYEEANERIEQRMSNLV